MPFALVTIGLVLIITGYQDTVGQLGKQVKSDFTGPGNFFYWVTAIGVVGSVGYIPKLQTPSRAFLVLVILALFLRRNGFFDNLLALLPNSSDALSGPTDTFAQGTTDAPILEGQSNSPLGGGSSGGSSVLSGIGGGGDDSSSGIGISGAADAF